MFVALICVIIFVCVLLVLVVLSQNSKGGGLSNQFGAGSSNLIGVKRTGDLLEKLTWGLGIGLVVLALSSNIILDRGTGAAQTRSVNQERAAQQGAAPAAAPVIPPTAPNNGTVPNAGTTTPAPTNNATPPVTADTAQ
jgi:preprotein translocase subunit SecG